MKNRFYPIVTLLIFVLLSLCACGTSQTTHNDGEKESTDSTVDGHVYGAGTYQQISQEEAQQIMETEEGIMILDVRTQEEYDSGHIPGAVCLPNETIQEAWMQQQRVEDSAGPAEQQPRVGDTERAKGSAPATEEPQQGVESTENILNSEMAVVVVSKLLPDKNQKILIYCRSGRRSKEAAQTLADMGYTNILEFGGIIDWTGEIITPESTSNVHLSIQGEELPVIYFIKNV